MLVFSRLSPRDHPLLWIQIFVCWQFLNFLFSLHIMSSDMSASLPLVFISISIFLGKRGLIRQELKTERMTLVTRRVLSSPFGLDIGSGYLWDCSVQQRLKMASGQESGKKCKRQARCNCHPWSSAHLKVKWSEIITMNLCSYCIVFSKNVIEDAYPVSTVLYGAR